MQYLVLEVDVFGIPLRVEGEPPENSWPIILGPQLKERIMEWNRQFGSMISASHLYSSEERAARYPLLNDEGMKLARLIEAEAGDGARVKYLAEDL
jgi:hypothetical protein